MSAEEQARQVRQVKKYETGVISDPITVGPEATIGEVLALTRSTRSPACRSSTASSSSASSPAATCVSRSRYRNPVSEIMTPKERLVTVEEGADTDQVMRLLHEHRIEKVLVVDEGFALQGSHHGQGHPEGQRIPECQQGRHRQLRVGAAVSTGQGTDERVEAWSTRASTSSWSTPRTGTRRA